MLLILHIQFIRGRQLVDNVLLATGIIEGYGRENLSPRCMLKIDMRKAYDSVEWSLLQGMLYELGFAEKFVRWTMECVTSVSYSVLINGKPIQGNPLCPYLFALCMEYLASCLGTLGGNKDYKYHPKCLRTKITHLAFANDFYFVEGIRTVRAIHEKYLKFSRASGLHLNPEKSAIYAPGVDEQTEKILRDYTSVQQGILTLKYLGVPLSSKKHSYN